MLDASSDSNLNLPSPMNGASSSSYPTNSHTPPLPTQSSISTMPIIPASDPTSDALDKEWINKAKYIVGQTKQDPFTQSKEIGKLKADYLRIRFNKHTTLKQDQNL